MTYHPRSLRRALLPTMAGVAALALLAGCSSAESPETDGAESISVQTSWIPSVEFGGAYLAEANGYYADAGLEVDILPGAADVDPTAIVAAGTADIGIGEPDNIARANASGADLVIIGATFQKNPLALLSTAENPIETPEDMYDKVIGVPAVDVPQHEALIALNDLDAERITSVPVQFDVSPLVSGEVDGMYVYYTSQPQTLSEQGVEPVTMLLADYGEPRYGDVYFTTRETLETRFDMLADFMRTQVLGWNDFVKDQSQAVDLAVNEYGKDAGLSESQQSATAALQVELIETDETAEAGLLTMSSDTIEQNIATIEAMGIEGADTSLFDSTVLEKALADLDAE